MFNKAKFIVASTLLFMHSFLNVAYLHGSEFGFSVYGPDDSHPIFYDSAFDACTLLERIEAPGKLLYHEFVLAHNCNLQDGQAPAAFGILSSEDLTSLSTCRVVLKKYLEEVRSGSLAMKTSCETNPFSVYRRSIIYGSDVVKDFNLNVDTESQLSEVAYSLAFPQGPDMVLDHPIVIVPHAQSYIFDMAHKSAQYKGYPFLKRICEHAKRLYYDACSEGKPICHIPLLIVDLKAVAQIVTAKDRLYSRGTKL